jgi:hypothetical protein
MLGDLAGGHLVVFALDGDERDAIGTGNSTKAHSP